MEYQLRLLLFIQSKHEIFGEPAYVSADGPVQITRRNAIKFGKIPILDHLLAAD
jgi:hypothetical protein